MAIQGVPPSNLAALNRVLSQIGKSMDETSPGGVQVSDVEAEKIIGAMAELPAEQKTLAESALKRLISDQFINVTDGGREKFAKAFNVSLPSLTPKATAELAGHTLMRTAFNVTMKAIAKTPQADRKWMNTFLGNVKNDLSQNGQQMLAAIMLNASKEGVFKFDTDARKGFTKWMAGINQEGAVTTTAARLETGHDPKMSAFERALAAGGFFEDILAAFMFSVVKDIQAEILEKTKELQNKEADEQKAANKKEMGGVSSLAERLIAEESTTTPDGKSPGPVDQATLMATRKNLESLVQSASNHLADDGFIDKGEATKLASRMDGLDAPIARLLARALNTALRRSDIDMGSDNIAPIIDWAKRTLSAVGEAFETTKLPKAENNVAGDGVASGLRDSDRLENRLASFLVDAFLTPNAPVYGPMPEKGRTISEHVKQFNQVFDGISESDKENMNAQVSPAQVAAMKAPEKPASNLPALLDDVGLGKLSDLFKGVDGGPSLLSRPTRKAAAEKFIGLLGGASPEMKTALRAFAKQLPDPSVAKTPADAEKLVGQSIALLEQAIPEAERVLSTLPAEAKAEILKLGKDATPEQLQAIAAKHAPQEVGGAENAGADVEQAAGPDMSTSDARVMSRQELFEQLKRLQSNLSEIMQAISNILSSMNQNAMNTIRAIR